MFRSSFSTSFLERFWLHFGSQNASLLAPFSHQNHSKNRSEIGLLKNSLQDRPKTAQDPPKMPPGPLRRPQDALRTAQKCPKMPSRTPTDDPKCFPKPLAQQPFSEKSKKSKSSKTCRKKRGRQRSSTVVTRIRPHKNREHFQNGRNPEGGGGGRAKRSSIRRPQRSTACCRSHLNISDISNDFKSLEGRNERVCIQHGHTAWLPKVNPKNLLKSASRDHRRHALGSDRCESTFGF